MVQGVQKVIVTLIVSAIFTSIMASDLNAAGMLQVMSTHVPGEQSHTCHMGLEHCFDDNATVLLQVRSKTKTGLERVLGTKAVSREKEEQKEEYEEHEEYEETQGEAVFPVDVVIAAGGRALVDIADGWAERKLKGAKDATSKITINMPAAFLKMALVFWNFLIVEKNSEAFTMISCSDSEAAERATWRHEPLPEPEGFDRAVVVHFFQENAGMSQRLIPDEKKDYENSKAQAGYFRNILTSQADILMQKGIYLLHQVLQHSKARNESSLHGHREVCGRRAW